MKNLAEFLSDCSDLASGSADHLNLEALRLLEESLRIAKESVSKTRIVVERCVRAANRARNAD